MRYLRHFPACTLFILLFLLTSVSGQQADIGDKDSVVVDGHLHSPGELLILLDRSSLVYSLDPLYDTSVLPRQEQPTLAAEYYVVAAPDGSSTLKKYNISDSVRMLVDSGDAAYSSNDVAKAREYYRQALARDSNFHLLITLIGNSFFKEGRMDSAEHYFKMAIARNPIDYDAHWFLGDTYFELSDTSAAVRELTIAHILNRNHESLLSSLKALRATAGRPWKEWVFIPRYHLDFDGHTVTVKADTTCLFYAMIKALWKYEPGYADAMRKGLPDSSAAMMTQEREAFIMQFGKELEKGRLADIISDRLLDLCILYEILLPTDPELAYRQDWKTLEKAAEYIDKFH